MMLRKNIYSCLVTAIVLLTTACQPASQSDPERKPGSAGVVTDERGFDPLELPRDREIVPTRFPHSGNIDGSAALIVSDEGTEEGQSGNIINLPSPRDTVQGQVFRVQLLTSKLYGEARRALQVAEEIFDQLVYLDYEVPYYKVRVGDFGARTLAEDYQMKAKAAGYPSCWVVVVNVGVREAPPLYDDPGGLVPVDSLTEDELEADDNKG